MDVTELYKVFLDHPSVCTDTRQLRPGDIFFALRGEKFNANLFIDAALGQGACLAVTDDKTLKSQDRILYADDVLACLQALASHHRKQFNIPILAITGSNGKTTTKELVAAVLSKKYEVVKTTGNLNNHIGVPLTLLKLNNKTGIAVVEMGANHIGEIGQLCQIAAPTHGLITNIGTAHIEGFGSFEGVIRAKGELYEYLRSSGGAVFINQDNDLLCGLSNGMKVISYGAGEKAMVKGSPKESAGMLEVGWSAGVDGKPGMAEEYLVKTNLFGNYNFENVMAAICIGSYFGIAPGEINAAIGGYKPGNNRSQAEDSGRNFVVRDAYNANPSSMEAALRHFASLPDEPKMAVLGDMFELGTQSAAGHKTILELAISLGFDKLVLIGPEFLEAGKEYRYPAFPTTREACDWFRRNSPQGYNILVKGSRGMAMESIYEFL